MPNRVVRESILESEKVNSLTWAPEVFYRRLMSIVDDFGRYEDNPKLLRAKLYPVLLDRVSLPDVEKWMRECVEAGLVRLYEVTGKKYLQVEEFNQTVRIKKPKYPPPPCIADGKQMQADASETKGNETETNAKPPQAKFLIGKKWVNDLEAHFKQQFPRAYQEFQMHFGKDNFLKWLDEFCTLNVDHRWTDDADLRDHVKNWCLTKQSKSQVNKGEVKAQTLKKYGNQ